MTRPKSTMWSNYQTERGKLMLACSRYNSAVEKNFKEQTIESYTERAKALQEWHEQDEKTAQIYQDYLNSYKIVNIKKHD